MRIGNWLFTLGIAFLFVAGSNLISAAQVVLPPLGETVNECQPKGSIAAPQCDGRCVLGATSWSCTAGVETIKINGKDTKVIMCYC
jgi:hypothetical protein